MTTPKKRKAKPPVSTPNPTPSPAKEVGQNVEKKEVKEAVVTGPSEDAHAYRQSKPKKIWQKVKEWETGNKIAAISAIVNAGMLVATLAIIIYTKRALETSNQALATTQQQFESANQPYLQISYVRDSLKPDKLPIIGYKIDNLAGQPVKLMLGRVGIEIMKQPENVPENWAIYESVRKIQTFPKIERYAIKESPFADTWVGGEPIAANDFHLIDSGVYHIFFYGDIVYVNLITHKQYRYHFRVKPIRGGVNQFRMDENDNPKISDTARNLGELLSDLVLKPEFFCP